MFNHGDLAEEISRYEKFSQRFFELVPLIDIEAMDAGIERREWQFVYAMQRLGNDQLFAFFYHPEKKCFWIVEFVEDDQSSKFCLDHSFFMFADDFSRRNRGILSRMVHLNPEAMGHKKPLKSNDLTDVLDDEPDLDMSKLFETMYR